MAIIERWLRKCYECGHIGAYKPNYQYYDEAPGVYDELECQKCHLPGLNYGCWEDDYVEGQWDGKEPYE